MIVMMLNLFPKEGNNQMPIYEFKCEHCDHTFELLELGETDKVEMRCPQCQSPNLHRLMSAASFSISGGKSGSCSPSLESHACASGSCSTMTLPGHTK